jgi:hypothetical protein
VKAPSRVQIIDPRLAMFNNQWHWIHQYKTQIIRIPTIVIHVRLFMKFGAGGNLSSPLFELSVHFKNVLVSIADSKIDINCWRLFSDGDNAAEDSVCRLAFVLMLRTGADTSFLLRKVKKRNVQATGCLCKVQNPFSKNFNVL